MTAAALAAALALLAGEPAPLEKVGFDEAVRRALAKNPGSVVAAEEVRRAEGILGEARSGSLPFLGVTGTLTRLDADRVTATGQKVAARDQQNATATLSLPLLAPSRWYQWGHASQSLDAAAAGEADSRRTVAVTAGRAYLTVIAQRRAVDVSTSARDTSKAHYEYARARRKGGVGNALDELRAEQELAAAEVQLESAQIGLARSREALGQIAGADAPLDAADEPALGELPGEAEAVATAESRPDVRAARARAHAAERVWKDSWADWLPTLTGTVQGFSQNPPSLTTPWEGWQAQLILSLPIFEGGLRPAQSREREALSNEAGAQLDATARQARSDVRTAFETLTRSRSAFQSARRGSEAARSALGLATKAYQAGAVDNLAVTDAEQRARAADLSAVIAEDAVRQSVLDLLAAAGRFP